MTECERIVKEGILPESFFQAEEQCGFWVDEKRKKIWAVELDLLVKFDEVCRKYGLTYYLICGTLLGAVRHHGFIPWDDDIDVAMPREDYDRLCYLKGAFSQPYFLQIPCEDKDYYFSYAKLRNTNTTGIHIPFRYAEFNQGMQIDIFALDNCMMESVQDNFTRVQYLIGEISANMRRNNLHPTRDDMERMNRFPVRAPKESYRELDEIITQYKDEKTEYCIISNNITKGYSYQKLSFRWDDFGKPVLYEFAGKAFPIPQNFDAVLRTYFGNYMEFPPLDMRGNWHTTAINEPDVSYEIYRSKLLESEN